MQIAEAFVAIRPKVDPAAFKREIEQAFAAGQTGTRAGQAIGKNLSAGATAGGKAAGTAAGQALGQTVTPESAKAGTKAGKALGDNMTVETRKAVRGLGQVVGVLGAGVFLKGAFAEITEANRATAQLGAVLRSTGAEAGVTEAHITALANSEKARISVDDDVIKRNAALLLTFRQVRNEVGAGNNIFDRSLKVSSDLAAGLDGDLQGALIQVGKAVNDPVRGLQALQRVGVTFTTQQRERVKALVESGRALDAQKIILAEIETQFGGAAAALAKADPLQRFNLSLQDFKERVGRDLLPTAGVVTNVLGNMFAVVEGAPAPLRATAAGLVGIAVAGAGIGRVASVVGELRAVLLGTAAAEGVAASAATVLKGALLGIGLAVGGIAILNTIIGELGRKAPDLERLTKATDAFAQGGKFGGALAESLGRNASDIGKFLEALDRRSSGALGHLQALGGFFRDPLGGQGGATEFNTANAQIKALDDTLAGLVSSGNASEARKLFKLLNAAAIEQGRSVDDLVSHLPHYTAALGDVKNTQDNTGRSVRDLNARLQDLASTTFVTRQGALTVADAFDVAAQAAKDLDAARRDVAGTGERAVAAARSERDAQRSLSDAYKGTKDAAQSLGDARKKLAEFDNPTSTRIRSLEREQIVHRIISNPQEARAKEADLLKFDQDNAGKREDLQHQIADAEGRVADAAQRVADAQDKVAEAAQRRKDVQIEAAQRVTEGERKLEEATIAAGGALAQFAIDADPGNKVLQGYIDKLTFLSTLLNDPSLAKSLASFAAGVAAVGPSAGGGNTPLGPPGPAAEGPRSDVTGTTATRQAHPSIAIAHNFLSLAALIKAGKINLDVLDTVVGAKKGQPRTEGFDFDLLNNYADPRIDVKKAKAGLTPRAVEFLRRLGIPGYARGGLVDLPRGVATLAVVHGQERITSPGHEPAPRAPTQVTLHNTFGNEIPTPAAFEFISRQLAHQLDQTGDR